MAILSQVAPSWMVQLPALLPAPALAALQATLAGATRARMLRELAEGLEALSAARPLVLVLEDLHWSDASTVEALALLARRRDPARLLVLGTYRPVDLIVHAHPLKQVKQELAAHGQCVEVPLRELSAPAVAAYVAQRGVAPEAHARVTAAVYRRTEGHPLFMVQLLDYLAHQDVLWASGAASGAAAARPLDAVLPQRLRHLLDAQLERLTVAEQQVLEVGSVAGVEFVVASVAAGLATPPAAIEAVCDRLVRQGQFLEERGLVAWPDGTVSGRYGFRHALYHEVVYQWLSPGRRMQYHQAIGAHLEAGYGAQAAAVAAALAMQGQGAAGLAQLRQGLAAILATGQTLSRPLCLVLLAEAMERAGQVAEGLRLLAEALVIFEASGRGDLLAETYRFQGELLLASAGTQHTGHREAKAEGCFQQALTIARRQQAKSWELRAALSLSRLWQQQGQRTEAYDLLAPLYGWFTEGFDTADLQEAKALLEELRG